MPDHMPKVGNHKLTGPLGRVAIVLLSLLALLAANLSSAAVARAAEPAPSLSGMPLLNLAVAAGTPMPLGQNGAWRLTFADDFASAQLDTSRWHTCFWWATSTCSIEPNHELQLYNPRDVLVHDGMLRLQAEQRPMVAWNGNTYSYTSGMVMTGGRKDETAPGFTFTYGYTEAQVRLPRGRALWPAFWMLPASYQSQPEVDIMEMLGDQPNLATMHVHWMGINRAELEQGKDWSGPDFSADWHTFGLDWQPDALVWYVDGVERWRVTDPASIPAEPMYLVLNLAVGGDWPGVPDASTPFPSSFDVRYVRVWSRAS